MSALQTPRFLYSPLAADPDLSDLVENFVGEIAKRLAALEECAARRDWGNVGRLAHQIKGAAGSYGFHDLTPFALQLEQAAKGGEPEEEILDAFSGLREICSRLRPGLPTGE
jgi:HPt (histidine-containing phosphotransfer) domain-containing protein